MTFAKDVYGKKVLVFGLGIQGGGLGDALWLVKHGATVKITDQKPRSSLLTSLNSLPPDVSLTLGGHSDQDILWADLIIKNPGVPDNQGQIELAARLNKPVLTSIAVVVSEAREQTIGVTGTRGKSTTTELIYQLLSQEYPGQVLRGGNIPSTSPLSLLDQLHSHQFLVLELSSFQLHAFHKQQISPHLAVVTNMYPDHLNRYLDMESYFYDKTAICAYQNQADLVIYNQDNAYSTKIAQLSAGSQRAYKASDYPATWTTNLLGKHNRENLAAALNLANAFNLNQEKVKDVLESFRGLPSRLETRRVLRGVTYINDTTSTTPTSTLKAIDSLTTPIILILGGADKKLPFDELLPKLKSTKVKGIVLLGCDDLPLFVEKIQQLLPAKIYGRVYGMEEAVQLAAANAVEGDAVLLSPGFASFDLFQNEFHRGAEFNQVVENLL